MSRTALLLVSALVSSVGCASAAPPPRADTTTTTAADQIVYRHRNHGGVLRLIAVSLQDLDLTPPQRATLEALRDQLLARYQRERDAGKALSDRIAEGVTEGAVDADALQPDVSKVGATAMQLHTASVDALNLLHALLTPEQRTQLMTKMQALWAEWASAPPLPQPSERGDLGILKERLGLTGEQVARIEARMHETMQGVVADYYPRDVTARADALARAFEASSFDAQAMELHIFHPPTFGASRMARFFEAMAPELTPAQREMLGKAIREHESRHDQP